jgi:hypothetical protein
MVWRKPRQVQPRQQLMQPLLLQRQMLSWADHLWRHTHLTFPLPAQASVGRVLKVLCGQLANLLCVRPLESPPLQPRLQQQFLAG